MATRIVKTLIALLLLLGGGSSLLFAGLYINPIRQEVKMLPGTTFSGSYTVRNEETYPVTVRVTAKDWFTLPENKDSNVSESLKFPVDEVMFQPNETKEIHYQINLASAAKGSHCWMVSFSPKGEGDQALTMVISGTLIVTASGTENNDWKITQNSLYPNSNKMCVAAELTNDGNVIVRPSGNAVISTRHSGFSKKLMGKKDAVVLEIPIEEGKPVYPGSKRFVTGRTVQDVNLEPGKYSALVNIKCGDQDKTASYNFKVKKTGAVVIE